MDESTLRRQQSMQWVAIAILGGLLLFLALKLLVIDPNKASHTKPTPARAPVSADGKSPAQMIVWVNTDSALYNYKYYKDADDSLKQEEKRLTDDLAKRERSLMGSIEAYQRKAQAGQLSADQAQLEEANLQRRQEDYVQYREAQLKKAEQRRAAVLERLQNQLEDFLKEFNADKGYSYVLGYSRGDNLLWADSTLDVTPEVIEGLNARYKGSK